MQRDYKIYYIVSILHCVKVCCSQLTILYYCKLYHNYHMTLLDLTKKFIFIYPGDLELEHWKNNTVSKYLFPLCRKKYFEYLTFEYIKKRRWFYRYNQLQMWFTSLNIWLQAKSLLSCLTLCDPMDCSLPGSSVHGILLARTLEWAAISSSRGSSWSRDQTCVSYVYLHWQVGSLLLAPTGKPKYSTSHQFLDSKKININF